MKTVKELAKEWMELNAKAFKGHGAPLNKDFKAFDVEGAMMAAYQEGYAQAVKDTPKEGKE